MRANQIARTNSDLKIDVLKEIFFPTLITHTQLSTLLILTLRRKNVTDGPSIYIYSGRVSVGCGRTAEPDIHNVLVIVLCAIKYRAQLSSDVKNQENRKKRKRKIKTRGEKKPRK